MKINKKIILVAAVMAVFGMAQVSAEISLDLGLIGGTGVGSVRTGNLAKQYGSDNGTMNFTGGVLAGANFSFGKSNVKFLLRPEMQILFNNGLDNGFKISYTDYRFKTSGAELGAVSVQTLEIPILLGVAYQADEKWNIDGFAGPYLSIPLGGSLKTASGNENLVSNDVNFGITAGVEAGYKIGVGAITFGARYVFDFAPTEMKIDGKSEEIYVRRLILANVGYKFIF